MVLQRLFENNNFEYNKVIIRDALTHLSLWLQLIEDKHNDFYIIINSNTKLCLGFKEKIEAFVSFGCPRDCECIFLGFKIQPTLFKNVKDTYYKYVPASQLYPRIKKDLSHIEIPKKFQDMSTTDLLRLRSSYGVLPDVIKAELDKREHIKKKSKTKIYGTK